MILIFTAVGFTRMAAILSWNRCCTFEVSPQREIPNQFRLDELTLNALSLQQAVE
jgi:hypothetical protein